MYGMPFWEMARIVYAVCTLGREHEEAGLVEGVKVDFRVNEKVQKNNRRQSIYLYTEIMENLVFDFVFWYY